MRLRELIPTLDNLARMGTRQMAARVYKKAYFRFFSRRAHLWFPPRVPATRRSARSRGAEVDPGRAREYLNHVVQAHPRRFFFAPEDREALVQYVQEHAPEARERVLREAEAWKRFEVDLLGLPTWKATFPIDWTANPYGNREWTWSLVRLPFLEPLAKAYLFTGDGEYARVLRTWLESFWSDAVAGSEACFESYSIARRALRLLFALHATHDSGIFDEAFSEAFLAHLLGEMHKLRWHLEHENPTNHLLLDYQALFAVGVSFAEYRPAARWQVVGWRGFRRELQRQFFDDHVHREQCTGYHLGILEKLAETVILARRQGIELTGAERDRVRGAFLFARAMTTADGTLPPLGDSPRRRYDEVGGSGAQFFQDPALVPPYGRLGEVDVWRFDANALRTWRRLLAKRETEGQVARFTPLGSGYHVHRGSGDAYHLVFDAGPIGHPRNPGHGHADALAVVLNVGDEPVLVDAGVGTYATGDFLCYYQGTRAHNTVSVDGRDQCLIWAFGRRKARLPRVRSLAVEDAEFLVWGGTHDGYARGKEPVHHERRVAICDDRLLIVWDRLTGLGTHTITAHWHFAPGTIDATSEGGFRFVSRREHFFDVASSRRSDVRVVEGRKAPLQGFVATGFGQVVEAPVLEIECRGEGPVWDALFFLALVPGERTRLERAPTREHFSVGCADLAIEGHWPIDGTPRFSRVNAQRSAAAERETPQRSSKLEEIVEA